MQDAGSWLIVAPVFPTARLLVEIWGEKKENPRNRAWRLHGYSGTVVSFSTIYAIMQGTRFASPLEI
jgi:hypothetical protein